MVFLGVGEKDATETLLGLPSNSCEELVCDNTLVRINLSLPQFFFECERALKPNGVLCLTMPNYFYFKQRLRFVLGVFSQEKGWGLPHNKIVKPTTVREVASQSNFDVMRWRPSNLFDREIKVRLRKRP